MKRLLSVLLCICMVMTLIPAVGAATATDIVWVGGFGMGDGTTTTYYKNDGTAGSDSEWNAKLYDDNGTLTLVLNGFVYEGEKNGVRAETNLKIVLEENNSIASTKTHIPSMPTNEAHGIFARADLEIVGTNGSILVVNSTNANAIMAYDPYDGYSYDESITITNADITANAGGDVGIVASESLTISGSVIQTTGKSHGLQGGGFGSSPYTNITVTDSTITATATGNDGAAFKSAPVVSEDYQWRSAVDGEWTAYASNDTDFTAAKYVEFKPGSPVSVELEDIEFTHAYDAQRSPTFPAKDDTITLRSLTYPLDANSDHMQKNDGEWTLTNIGAYYFMKDTASDHLKEVIEGVAGNYTGINTDEIIIHELKDGDTHIAYGVVVAFDAEEQRAFYLGDTWSNGAGYLLAVDAQNDPTTMTAMMVPTDFIEAAEYKIEIDKIGTYTFAEASSGYEAQTPVTVTVSNTGTAATGELTVSLSGEDAESFELSTTTIDSIEVDGEATFTVVPKEDLEVTTHTATVSVGSDTIIPKSFNVSFSVVDGEGEGGGDDEEEQPSGKGHYGGLQAGGDTSRTGADNLGSQYKDEDEPETETKPVVKPDDGVCDGTNADNCPAAKFADLNTSAWYHADADYVIKNGLFNGTSATAFSPNGKLTRAMLVAVLYRAEGSPATNKSIPFADVDMSAYYANAVIWAQQNRIVTGVSETKFAPDENITREQIATILYRYAAYKGKSVEVKEEALSFADASSVSDYALTAMTWNIKNGFVQGRSGNMLAPREFATRAEATALLHRFLEAK